MRLSNHKCEKCGNFGPATNSEFTNLRAPVDFSENQEDALLPSLQGEELLP
jgi:hypothetical protein